MAQEQQTIGFIGLGVMGKNLVLNLADHGYHICGFDLDAEKVADTLATDAAERGEVSARIEGTSSIEAMLTRLPSPRVILLSVPAGKPVDAVCESLLAAGIQPDDVVVDTGNSLWTNTVEREAQFRGKFMFFSCAVSGGEVGARFGPSLMPSGDESGWTLLAPVLEAISAKVDPQTGLPLESNIPGQPVTQGEPCTTYIGPAGSGHYVKMVHNGIEYADMQLICEAYQMMRSVAGMTPVEIGKVFELWNQGVLNSYLIEITADILQQTDPKTGAPIVDVIMDKAGQKGTGLWTAVSSLELGVPASAITQAVYARVLSSLKSERIVAQAVLTGPESTPMNDADKAELIQQLHDALYCSKLCAYAQGFHLMKVAAEQQQWQLDFASIAKIWRAGCIIRARFLHSITQAYEAEPGLANLLLAPYFADQVNQRQQNWRKAVAQGALNGVALPAFSASLAYYDSYRAAIVPANLLQAQRDFFGAHTFERTDSEAGTFYHIEWSHAERELVRVK